MRGPAGITPRGEELTLRPPWGGEGAPRTVVVGCRGARVRFFPWHKHVLPPLRRHRGRQTRSRLSGEHGPGGGHHGTDGEGAARLQLEQPGPGSEPPPPSSPPRLPASLRVSSDATCP